MKAKQFILRGLDTNGDEVFYCVDGDGWLSSSISAAFRYHSAAHAEERAKSLNSREPLTGVWFTVSPVRK